MTPNPEFMKLAVAEACEGVQAGHGGPFGAVIVRNGEIIARGHNMVLGSHDVTAHAEVTAIRNACSALKSHDLSDCEMYTSCYPCPMCMGASLWAHLKAVYYAATSTDAALANFDDSAFHDFVKNPVSNDQQKWERVTVPNFVQPFEEWQKKEDKVPY